MSYHYPAMLEIKEFNTENSLGDKRNEVLVSWHTKDGKYIETISTLLEQDIMGEIQIRIAHYKQNLTTGRFYILRSERELLNTTEEGVL